MKVRSPHAAVASLVQHRSRKLPEAAQVRRARTHPAGAPLRRDATVAAFASGMVDRGA